MDTEALQRMIADPAEFRRALGLPARDLADFQQRDFAAMDPAFVALAKRQTPERRRFWLERTKGASKDSDLAALVLWALAVTALPLVCQAGAADAEQAGELRKAMLAMVRQHPAIFGKSGFNLEVQANAVVNLRTLARLDIIPADEAGSHGARPDLLIINELTHHGKEEFAQVLLDNAEKVPHGVVIVATNAGHRPSWQWDLREMARESPRWYFATHDQPAPWIDAEGLAERQRSTSPSRFNRLWRGIWVDGANGDALDSALLSAAFSLSGPTLRGETGWVYSAGLDLGIKKDASALVVVGKNVGHQTRTPRPQKPLTGMDKALIDAGIMERPETGIDVETFLPTGKLRVCSVQVWRPDSRQVDLSVVEGAVIDAHKRFALSPVAYDPWQCSYLAERLIRRGVPMMALNPTPQNLSGMASAVLEAVNERLLETYADPNLKYDLERLRLVEKTFGIRLESPHDSTGHGDSASALANALLVVRRAYQTCGPVSGELVCWPAL